ncbi:hypothetical protein [Halobacteriovorax sp. DPLXC-1]|uniref:hypothetical protein n=1 Tax=Halobacteriovorax sp. DPLXC-1 TaxID=3110771 RepID=UPI002FF3FAC2
MTATNFFRNNTEIGNRIIAFKMERVLCIPTSNWKFIPFLKKERRVPFDMIKKVYIDYKNIERFKFFEITVVTNDFNNFIIKDKEPRLPEAEKFLVKLKSLDLFNVE